MRYRKLSSDGDMQFGHNSADIWKDVPDVVGQAIKTRLLQYRGEWFLDVTEGMPWGGFPINDDVVTQGQVLGRSSAPARDTAIKIRVLETPGVVGISDYSSSLNSDNRAFSVSMKVTTIYGREIRVRGMGVDDSLNGVFTSGL
jgi:hypothetical protein